MMLVNGAPAESITAADRGLAYGDGVFRTLSAINGKPLHWTRQYDKLSSDCAALGIVCPPASVLLAEVQTAAAGHAQAAVKILVTRGCGPRGYAPPAAATPTRVVSAETHAPASRRNEGVSVHLCRLRLAHQPALAGIKHLNRLENVLARAEWHDAAIGEGLLLDQDGNAIGGTMSNLFVADRGVLVTPDVSRCGVSGVTRARVIDLARTAGFACRIEPVSLQRVLDADEVFFVNSLIGVWPVACVVGGNGRQWRVGPLTQQVMRWLEADDAASA